MIPDAISSEQLNKFRELGKSWLSKAENARRRSREEIEKMNYSEAVSASLECIEFSIKATFLFYGFEFPKIHKVELEISQKKPFKDALERLKLILGKLPDEYEKEKMKKCFFYFKFWGEFYTLAKYGSVELGIGPEKLFKEKEAKLALDHADECVSLVYDIKSHLKLY